MKPILTLTAFLFFFKVISFAQLPDDNPYFSKYKIKHWSDTLKWKNVTDATKVLGLVKENKIVDSAILNSTLKEIAKGGGGILYFPKGTYYLNFNLFLVSDVIIRGETPYSNTEAKTQGFDPPTKFEFPEYKPVYSDNGNPKSNYKAILADTLGLKNFGLVNLSINRAAIGLYAGGYLLKDSLQNKIPSLFHQNVIIFGVRQNNAAVLSPDIPSKYQKQKGQLWVRWPWQFGSNIDIVVSKNCVVANCRLNDNVTDNYKQPGYIPEIGEPMSAEFNYSDHSGISINNNKVQVRSNWNGNLNTPRYTFIASNSPVNKKSEPFRYFSNIEVLDNYVVTTEGNKAINAAGENIVLRDNTHKSENAKRSLTKNGLFVDVDFLEKKNLFDKHIYVSTTKDTLPYRLITPEGYNKSKSYPLILFLHGIDGIGKNNLNQLKSWGSVFSDSSFRKNHPCFVLAPQYAKNVEWTTGMEHRPSKSLASAIEVLKKLEKTYNIDYRKVYIIGVETGGAGAWEAAIRYPGLFSAIVSMDAVYNISPVDATKIKKVNSWVFHSGRTGIPMIYFDKFVTLLDKNKLNYKLTKYENESRSWLLAAREQNLFTWLFAQ